MTCCRQTKALRNKRRQGSDSATLRVCPASCLPQWTVQQSQVDSAAVPPDTRRRQEAPQRRSSVQLRVPACQNDFTWSRVSNNSEFISTITTTTIPYTQKQDVQL